MILQRIKDLCEERKISIAKLEEAAGLGNATIRKWEKSYPRADKLKAVADVLGVSLDYLVSGEKSA